MFMNEQEIKELKVLAANIRLETRKCHKIIDTSR